MGTARYFAIGLATSDGLHAALEHSAALLQRPFESFCFQLALILVLSDQPGWVFDFGVHTRSFWHSKGIVQNEEYFSVCGSTSKLGPSRGSFMILPSQGSVVRDSHQLCRESECWLEAHLYCLRHSDMLPVIQSSISSNATKCRAFEWTGVYQPHESAQFSHVPQSTPRAPPAIFQHLWLASQWMECLDA